jgi:serine/threonine kinase PknH
MTAARTPTAMDDDSAIYSDKPCLPVGTATETPVYTGSGWSAFREQVLREPGHDFTHYADQGVVLFSSAHDAGAFFTASTQRWSACANRQFTKLVAGKPDAVITVGPVSNTNGTLSATITAVGGYLPSEHALTVANNVVIDVITESNQANSAVDIAQQIAAKVPK